MARAIDANALHAEISKWPESVMYKDWVQSAIANAPTLTPPNEAEYREYTCSNCYHTWQEDRDASDYPNYCPGCGEALNRRPPERQEDAK